MPLKVYGKVIRSKSCRCTYLWNTNHGADNECIEERKELFMLYSLSEAENGNVITGGKKRVLNNKTLVISAEPEKLLIL